MFKSWSIKKYGYKLHHKLVKRYGVQHYYSIHQVRATVYKCNFNPKHLPLAYLLYLSPENLSNVMNSEFPDISIPLYRKEMLSYFGNKNSNNYTQTLNQV